MNRLGETFLHSTVNGSMNDFRMLSSPSAAPLLLDHADSDISTQPSLAALDGACRRAIGRQLRWQAASSNAIGGSVSLPLVGEFEPPAGSSEWADGVVLEPLPDTPSASAPRLTIAYLIMGHRPYAHETIGRLVSALWDPAHLFLVHLDGRTNASTVSALHRLLGTSPNVRFMRPRRSVGWGAFSMVEVMLSVRPRPRPHAHPHPLPHPQPSRRSRWC